jgi:hypothetical protein
MTLKAFVRLSAYSLIVGLAFVAQKAICLPFWDSGTNYNTATGSNCVNLSGQINPEGNTWYAVGTNPIIDVLVSNYVLTYPGLECSASNVFVLGATPSSTSDLSERIAINPPMAAGNTFTGVNSGYSITNGFAMGYSDNSATIYYSFIFQLPYLGALPSTAGFVCGFNNVEGPQSGAISIASGRLYFKTPSGTGGTNYLVGIGANTSAGSAATFLTNVYNTNSTNFLVVGYTFQAGTNVATLNGSNNYVQMWLNPDPSTFGATSPPGTNAIYYDNGGYALNTNNAGGLGGGAASNQVMSFYFRQGNSAEPLVYAADLRVGLCWDCVAPPTNNPAPQKDTLSITAASSNLAVISFKTNTPCYLMQKATNIAHTTNFTTNYVPTSTNWAIITTPPTLVGTDYVVTNVTSVTTVTTTFVTNGMTITTNYSTNVSFPPAYYQVKTYAN